MINFIKQEKRIALILALSIVASLIYIFSNRLPELFPFGYEIMLFIYTLAVSVIAAIIFYFFQIYLPSIKIRKIAQKEVLQICSRLTGAFTDMLISCSTKEEIGSMKISSLDILFGKPVASQICKKFDLEAEANYSPKMSWANRLAILGQETKDRCDIIVPKYSIYLSENTLEALHELRNDPLIEYIRTLSNREAIEFQKKYHKRTFLPVNFIEIIFNLLNSINKKLNLGLSFSSRIFDVQWGLYEKARIRQ